MLKFKGGHWIADGPLTEHDVLSTAYKITRKKAATRKALTDPSLSKDLFFYKLCKLEHEVFSVMYLDNRHRLIDHLEMFRGTINGASVHPREIVKEALKHNAAAVIFGHNHPSGDPEPSQADRNLTQQLVSALELIDVRVLDHIVVGDTGCISFAERGWI